jgi:hypothetical protein
LHCKCPLMTQSGHECWSPGPIFKVAFLLSGDQLHWGALRICSVWLSVVTAFWQLGNRCRRTD